MRVAQPYRWFAEARWLARAGPERAGPAAATAAA